MGGKKTPYWRTLGTPTYLVLYRTPELWRFAFLFVSGEASPTARRFSF